MAARNIYRSFYILIGILGISIEFGIFYGSFNAWVLIYYTVLSNILCVSYFTLRFHFDNKRKKTSAFRNFIMSPLAKYSITMCITLTFLVYHFMLAPTENTSGEFNISVMGNYIVHYIIPIMTIIDFLIFDKQHEKLKWYAPFIWMIIPVIYITFIFLRAPIMGNIGTTDSPYPYPFIDLTIQSIGSVAINILTLLVGFIILSYILLFLDNLTGKLAIRKKQ